MGELLAASGLLLGAIGMVYSSWYPDIRRALDEKVQPKRADRTSQRKRHQQVYWGKVFPIMVTLLLFALALLPKAWSVVRTSIRVTSDLGLDAVSLYDAALALFVLIEAVAAALTIHLMVIAYQFRNRRLEIDGPDK